MFRISLFVYISLIFSISAKPYKSWNKLTDEAFQDIVMSDATGKISWGVEVEPPEDLDETQYDIDPSMMIWKSVTGTGQEKQHWKAEEDLDELYHPSVGDLLNLQMQNHDALYAANIQSEPLQEDANPGYNQVPEEDKDDIDHPDFSHANLAPQAVEPQADMEVQAEPEEDKDELYPHPEQLRREVRVHLQPEEDMDDLYHADVPQKIPHQDYAKAAAAPAHRPSQRKHSEPEKDLDDLFHL